MNVGCRYTVGIRCGLEVDGTVLSLAGWPVRSGPAFEVHLTKVADSITGAGVVVNFDGGADSSHAKGDNEGF